MDLDDAALALAQQQPETRTKRDTINQALMIAAGSSADERARAWAWRKEKAEAVLDFDVLEADERAGR